MSDCPTWPRCQAEMIDLTDLVQCQCDGEYPAEWTDWDVYVWEKRRSQARWAASMRREGEL